MSFGALLGLHHQLILANHRRFCGRRVEEQIGPLEGEVDRLHFLGIVVVQMGFFLLNLYYGYVVYFM